MERRRWSQVGIAATVFIVLLALVAVASGGCGSASASGAKVTLTGDDNGKAYTVKVGDTIEVTIPGNPTTGYEWAADLSDEDAAVLEAVGEPAYQPDTTDASVVGSGGKYTFTFKAATAGEATLRLVYSRSWEDVEPIETFEVTVSAQ